MNRDSIALIIRPYKNSLMPPQQLKGHLDRFAERVASIAATYPNLRFNTAMPGYMLQHMDPIKLASLNEIKKNRCLEWLFTGYTEPFIGFSPIWLSEENLAQGRKTFEELTGEAPRGFIPAFSNWEPSIIDSLRKNNIGYTVLSNALISKNYRNQRGYWITEHMGSSMTIIPSISLHPSNAPANILRWLNRKVEDNKKENRLITIDFLTPLDSGNDDPFEWIELFAKKLDTILLNYRLILLAEMVSDISPRGVQYIPPGMVLKRGDDTVVTEYANYLHTFDSLGLMQRKMLNIAERVSDVSEPKEKNRFLGKLFTIQDINRYIPSDQRGFSDITDRTFTFENLIELENQLDKNDSVKGGKIAITDVLRTGIKSIVLSNENLKVFINHKHGGQIFELDYLPRSVNVFSAHEPEPNSIPSLYHPPGRSEAFREHFLDLDCDRAEFMSRTAEEHADFSTGVFEYDVKKDKNSVKALLSGRGVVSYEETKIPVSMEKEFYLNGQKPILNYSYKLYNNSLTKCEFRFAVEVVVALPGVIQNKVSLKAGSESFRRLNWDRGTIESIDNVSITDSLKGFGVKFKTAEKCDLWFYPAVSDSAYQGTALVLTFPVELNPSESWEFAGELDFRKVRITGESSNVI